MKYKYIIHLADIHIRNGTNKFARYDEYKECFENLKNSLNRQIDKKNGSDETLIVVAGDIFHNKNKVENFGLDLFKIFLGILRKIAPTVIIPGNHDFLQQYPNDPSLLDAVMLPDLVNLYYLPNTSSISIGNIGISTISVKDTLIEGEGSGIKIVLPEFPMIFDENVDTKVALFHGSFNKSFYNHNIDVQNSYPLEMLKDFDIGCLGDIHLTQEGKYKRCNYAYSGSLIQQNYGEDIIDHGYRIWNVKNKKSRFIPVYNNNGFVIVKKIDLIWHIKYKNKFIFLTDIIENKYFPKKISLRIDGEMKKMDEILEIFKLNNININEIRNIDIIKNVKGEKFDDINYSDMKYFKDYFNNISDISNDMITFIKTSIDNPHSLVINIEKAPQCINEIINKRNIKIKNLIENYIKGIDIDIGVLNINSFNIIELKFNNTLCYGNNNCINFKNWRNKTVIINAPNGFGKSALYEILCYSIFGEPMNSRVSKKFTSSFINSNKTKDDVCNTEVSLLINDYNYIIKRFYKSKNKVLTIYETSIVCIDNKEFKELIGNKQVNKWINDNIGTIDDFLKTAMITQDFDYSVLSMEAKEVKKYIDKNINMNAIIGFRDAIKEVYNSYKDILQHIESLIIQTKDSINIVDLDEKSINNGIKLKVDKKNELYERLNNDLYINYNSFSIDFEKSEIDISKLINLEYGKERLVILHDKVKNINYINYAKKYSSDVKELFNCMCIPEKPIFSKIEMDELYLKIEDIDDVSIDILNKKLEELYIQKPITIKIDIKKESVFKNIDIIKEICNKYDRIKKSIKGNKIVENVDNLNDMLESNINNDIIINNNNIELLQEELTLYNIELHNLLKIKCPIISFEDATDNIKELEYMNTLYDNKNELFDKYNKKLEILYEKEKNINDNNLILNEQIYDLQKELSLLQKELYLLIKIPPPKICIDECKRNISLLNSMNINLNQKRNELNIIIKCDEYHIQLKNNMCLLNDLKDVIYNDKCEICIKQPWVINKCNIIKNIKELNSDLSLYEELYKKKESIKSWISDYNELSDKNYEYERNIIESNLYDQYLLQNGKIQEKIDNIINNIENYNKDIDILNKKHVKNMKQIKDINTNIDFINIKEWLDKYLLLNNKKNENVEAIDENKKYNEYKNLYSVIKKNLDIINKNIKEESVKKQDAIKLKDKNIKNIGNIEYTIFKAYECLDQYNADLYTKWLLDIENIRKRIKTKPLVEKYINMKKIYEDYVLYTEYENIILSYELCLIEKDINSWCIYNTLCENIRISKIHIERDECVKNIKNIEDDINELIINKTLIQVNNNTELICNNLLDVKTNIKENLENLKVILDNYNLFQNWLYSKHILPNIIKKVNNIILNSIHKDMCIFSIDAFIDKDGIQFILNNNGLTSINKASGFQKFLINIALRLAFTELHTNGCKCEQLFLDEGWTSADQFNRNLIPTILQFLLTKYVTVILVSHIDEIKDNVDIKVNIIKNIKGVSKINTLNFEF